MKLIEAVVRPIDANARIKKLTLEAEIAQGRLMIAQLASRIRIARAELHKLDVKLEKGV